MHPSRVVEKGLLRNGHNGQVEGILVIIRFLTSFILVANAFAIVQRIYCVRDRTSISSRSHVLIVGCPSFARKLTLHLRDFAGHLGRQTSMDRMAISKTIPKIRMTGCFAGHPCKDSPSRIGLVRVFTMSCSCLSTCVPTVVYKQCFSRSFNNSLGQVILGRRTIELLNCRSPRTTLKRRIGVRIMNRPLRVVKIIGGCRRRSLSITCGPVVFFVGRQMPFVTAPCVSIHLANRKRSDTLVRVRRVCRRCFPASLFSCFFLDSLGAFLCGSSHGFN